MHCIGIFSKRLHFQKACWLIWTRLTHSLTLHLVHEMMEKKTEPPVPSNACLFSANESNRNVPSKWAMPGWWENEFDNCNATKKAFSGFDLIKYYSIGFISARSQSADVDLCKANSLTRCQRSVQGNRKTCTNQISKINWIFTLKSEEYPCRLCAETRIYGCIDFFHVFSSYLRPNSFSFCLH